VTTTLAAVATTTLATIATTTGVTLCQNQNTCQNLGVCYLFNGATLCVCPQGESQYN
jgi:hypothetical protein